MKRCLIYILISLTVTLLYLAGLVFFLTDHEPGDKCEMTYMFEYPQYIKISQEVDKIYPKYGLYAYGEGRTTKNARNMHFNGIPVLFVPGNAGSHKQVRSLSSVALRKALNSGSSFHFDYFTVDLNSEFSALYGPILHDQLIYVLKSIVRILDLYKNNSSNSPKQIILIGHSVGGIVAKKAISQLLKQKSELVSILIMLATPVTRGPIYFDRTISNFYADSLFDQDNVTTISIAGGYSDNLVPSYLTANKGNSSINLVATNIAKSWVESNHIQILWCKQIVLAINRALFDCVDRHTHQISADPTLIKKTFEHHLVHNSGTQLHITGDPKKLVKIDYKGEWFESLYKQYTVEHERGVKQPHWYMVAITTQPTYEMLTVLALNLEVTDWAFACNAAYPNKASRVCIEGEHLTQYSEIFPTSRYKRRLLSMNMHEIRRRNQEFTHVVFRVLPTSEPVTFHLDTYGSFEREALVSLPIFNLKKQIVLAQTPEKALIYNLIFPELNDPLQIYQLFIEPVRCNNNKHHATASLIVPWANESVHAHFTESLNKPLILRLQHPKPSGVGNAMVRLVLEPTCTYQISIRFHILGVFGQIARYYSTFILSTLAVVFLLAFQSQINVMSQTSRIPIFFSSIFEGSKQIWVLMTSYILSLALKNYLPEPEFRIFSNNIYIVLAMTVLFMVSYILLLILVAAYCISLFTLESTVHKLTLKLLARTITSTIRFSDYFMSFLQKVPLIVAAALILLSFSTCGGLALCVGLVFYFLKLTQMSQDYVEQVAWYILKTVARKLKGTLRRPKSGVNTDNQQTFAIEDSENKNEAIQEKKADYNLNEDTAGPSNSYSLNKEEILKNDEEIYIKKCENIIEEETHKPEETSLPCNSHENALSSESNDIKTIADELNSQNEANESVREVEDRTEEITETNETRSEERPPLKDLSKTNNAIFFHSSIFFIWVFVTILNIPAVLTWAHNFRYSKHLSHDESFIPGLIFSIGSFFLWEFDLPRTNRKHAEYLRILTLCFIPIIFLYASVSVYRINYILTLLFILVLLQQIVAPKSENDEESPKDSEDKNDDKYDQMKMKVD